MADSGVTGAAIINPLEVELAEPGGMPRLGGRRALVGGGVSLIALALAISSSLARSSSDVCGNKKTNTVR